MRSRPRWLAKAVLWGCILQLTATSARCEQGGAPFELSRTDTESLALESAVSTALLGGSWMLAGSPRKRCRWCRVNSFDTSIRESLRSSHPRTAALLSHVTSLGLVPVVTLSWLAAPAWPDGRPQRALEDVWITLNGMALTTATAVVTKRVAARQRPAFHYVLAGDTEYRNQPFQENQSFFSVDTAWAFSIASSATTLAALHGYEAAPFIGIAGGALASTAGILRIAADVHWGTDVIAGAAVGTLIGAGLPLLAHPRRGQSSTEISVSVLASPDGVQISGCF